MSEVLGYAVSFLTGKSPYSAEFQAMGMAFQGAVAVRRGPNRDNKMPWFHAFTLSVLTAYAGATFGLLWMGKPSSMLSNDLNMGSCIVAFVLVNYVPGVFALCNTLPVAILIVSAAQLFRSLGTVKFVSVCHGAFKDSPSAYYPIPVFGPILYATMLGNMGGLFMKGYQGHVQNGMPWPFQLGLFNSAFFHFYVNDETGPIGTMLRKGLEPMTKQLGLDDQAFAVSFVSLFYQLCGIAQMPFIFGPSFSPFVEVQKFFITPAGSSGGGGIHEKGSPPPPGTATSVAKTSENSLNNQKTVKAPTTTTTPKQEEEPQQQEENDDDQEGVAPAKKKKKKKKKKKTA